jgi:ABC-type uncharacterized transport system auxiliary subunit
MTRIIREERDRTCSDTADRRMVLVRREVMKSVVCLAALVILTGCVGKVRHPNYYFLNSSVPPDPPAATNMHATLAIRQFRAPTYLRQGAIVYKTSPEQIGFYAYHRWASDPRDFVTNSIAERIRASGVFTRVQVYDESPDVDYVLSGRLEKLEELDYQGRVKVQVAISAEMTSVATGAVVWSNAVSEVADVNNRDVPAVVSEMNQMMQQAIEKLLTPLSAGLSVGSTAAERH